MAAQLGLVVNLGGTAGAAACMAPDGSLYLADSRNHRIRRVTSGLSGSFAGEFGLPSADGSLFYKFDAGGRHLQTLNSLTGGVLHSFEYNSNGRLSAITDGDGNVTRIEGNANGPTAIVGPFGPRTTLTVDGNGYLSTVANPAGEVIQLAYTDNGLLSSLVDPNGNAPYQFLYDELGRLVKDIDPAGGFKELARTELEHGVEVSVTTAEGRVSRYRREHLATGEKRHVTLRSDRTQVVTTTSSNGSQTTIRPDGSVVTTVESPDPRFGLQVPYASEITLATGGKTLTVNETRSATLTDPDDPLTLTALNWTIDRNGRVSTIEFDRATQIATASTPGGRQLSVAYDQLGRWASVHVPGFAPMSLSYDSFGQLHSVSQGDRNVTYTYVQGFLDRVALPQSRSYRLSRDDGGRIVSLTSNDGTSVGFAYDANSNLTSITPPGRPSHRFSHDAVNRITRYSPPPSTPGGPIQTTYNLDHQPVMRLRPDGQHLDAEYGADGRISKLSFSEGQLSFDNDGATGSLTGISGPGGVALSYGYDGALLSMVGTTGETPTTIGFEYDEHLRPNAVSLPGLPMIEVDYDPDDFVTRIGEHELSRDPSTGAVTSSTLRSVSDVLEYNEFGELVSYEARALGSSLFAMELERDAAGRVVRRIESVDGQDRTIDYVYDAADRLSEVRENGIATTAYTYDANGNRLAETTPQGQTTATYDDQDRLLTYGDATYTYTASGELASAVRDGETTRYVYDTLGGLRRVELPDGAVIEYVLDPVGRRLAKKVNGAVVQRWAYAGRYHHPFAELDADGEIVSLFLGSYMLKDGAVYRILRNQVGSPRVIVDASSGQVVQRMNYDAFGQVTEDTNPGFQPFGFAGGLYDRDTQLVRFGLRDYDPTVGRWTTKDPAGFLGGEVNLYTYTANDPVNLIDPTGLEALSADEQALLGQAFSFIEDHSQGIDAGVVAKLRSMVDNGEIVKGDPGENNVALYSRNWLGWETITIKTQELEFALSAYNDLQTASGMVSAGELEPGRLDGKERVFYESYLKLAAALLHEGVHAEHSQSERADDELGAYTAEALLLRNLYYSGEDPCSKARIRQIIEGLSGDLFRDTLTTERITVPASLGSP